MTYFLTKRRAALLLPTMRFGNQISSFGTAMRCAMTLIILIASLARGAVVLELKHEHHHDHDFHHSHQHESGSGQSEDNDGEDGETAPERNTEDHSHRLIVDAGPMMPHLVTHAEFVPVGGSAALAILHQQCPDGPHFELIKPPQIG